MVAMTKIRMSTMVILVILLVIELIVTDGGNGISFSPPSPSHFPENIL